MLSPNQANEIADDLLQQALQQRNEVKNVAAKRVPLLFRIPELRPLEPWERSERVGAAVRSVNNQVVPILACLVWTVGCLAVAWSLDIFSQGRPSTAVLLVLSIAPWHLIRAVFVRSNLRKQLNQVQNRH